MHEQLDSLQALLDCPTADALRLQSGQLLNRLGFENWIYTSGSNANRLPVWLNAYPADWMAHYRRQGYFEVDPVVEHCRHHTTPCLWAADPHARRVGYPTEFFREAADYGLRLGIGLPIHGPAGQAGMISVATGNTSKARENLHHLGELHLFASFLHEAGQRLVSTGSQEQVHLTARELDCLRWAAEGRTSWEIGQQLSIGERTVVFHLQNAARKLGVMGRRQAIAKAMSLQLIAL